MTLLAMGWPRESRSWLVNGWCSQGLWWGGRRPRCAPWRGWFRLDCCQSRFSGRLCLRLRIQKRSEWRRRWWREIKVLALGDAFGTSRRGATVSSWPPSCSLGSWPELSSMRLVLLLLLLPLLLLLLRQLRLIRLLQLLRLLRPRLLVVVIFLVLARLQLRVRLRVRLLLLLVLALVLVSALTTTTTPAAITTATTGSRSNTIVLLPVPLPAPAHVQGML